MSDLDTRAPAPPANASGQELRSLREEYNARALPGRQVTQVALVTAYARGQAAVPDASPKIRHLYGLVRARSYLSLLATTSTPHNLASPDRDLLPPAHPFSARAPITLIAATTHIHNRIRIRPLVATVVMDSLGRPWNSLLHPRDRYGRFIPTFGSVRLFKRSSSTGTREDDHYATGRYMGANPDGSVNVRITATNDPDDQNSIGTTKVFPADQVGAFSGGSADTTPGDVDARTEKARIGDIPTSAGEETQEYRNVAARNAFQEGIRDLGDTETDNLSTPNGDTYRTGDQISADVGTAVSDGKETSERVGTILNLATTRDGKNLALVRYDNQLDESDKTPEVSILDLDSDAVRPVGTATSTPQVRARIDQTQDRVASVDTAVSEPAAYSLDGGPPTPDQIDDVESLTSPLETPAKRTPSAFEKWVSGNVWIPGANRRAARSRRGMEHVGDREIRDANGESAGVGSIVVIKAPEGSGRRSNLYTEGVIAVVTNINPKANKGYGGARLIVWDPEANDSAGGWRFLSQTHVSGNRFELVKEGDPSLLNVLGKGIDVGGGMSLMPQNKRIARTLTRDQVEAGVTPIDQRVAADFNGDELRKGDHVTGVTAAGQLVQGHIQNVRPNETLIDVTPYGGGEAITISANRTRFMRKSAGQYGTADRDDVFYEDAADFNMPVYDRDSLADSMRAAGASDEEIDAMRNAGSAEEISEQILNSDARKRIGAQVAKYNELDLDDEERHSPEARQARMIDHMFRGAIAGRLLESDGGEIPNRPPEGQTRAEGELEEFSATFPQSFGDFGSDDSDNEYFFPDDLSSPLNAVTNPAQTTTEQAVAISIDDPRQMTIEMQTVAAWLKAENHARGPQMEANAAIQAATVAVAKSTQPHRSDAEKADLLARAADRLRAVGNRRNGDSLKPTLDAMANRIDEYAEANGHGHDQAPTPNVPDQPAATPDVDTDTDFTPPPPPTPAAPTPTPTSTAQPEAPAAPSADEPLEDWESELLYGPVAGSHVEVDGQEINVLDDAVPYVDSEYEGDGPRPVHVRNADGSWNTWTSGTGTHYPAGSPEATALENAHDDNDLTPVPTTKISDNPKPPGLLPSPADEVISTSAPTPEPETPTVSPDDGPINEVDVPTVAENGGILFPTGMTSDVDLAIDLDPDAASRSGNRLDVSDPQALASALDRHISALNRMADRTKDLDFRGQLENRIDALDDLAALIRTTGPTTGSRPNAPEAPEAPEAPSVPSTQEYAFGPNKVDIPEGSVIYQGPRPGQVAVSTPDGGWTILVDNKEVTPAVFAPGSPEAERINNGRDQLTPTDKYRPTSDGQAATPTPDTSGVTSAGQAPDPDPAAQPVFNTGEVAHEPSPSLPTSGDDDAWGQAASDAAQQAAARDANFTPPPTPATAPEPTAVPTPGSSPGTPNPQDMVSILASDAPDKADQINALMDTWFSQTGYQGMADAHREAWTIQKGYGGSGAGFIYPEAVLDLHNWQVHHGMQKMGADGVDIPDSDHVLPSMAAMYSGYSTSKPGQMNQLQEIFTGTSALPDVDNEVRAQSAMALAQLVEKLAPSQGGTEAGQWYRAQAVRLRDGQDIDLRSRPRIEAKDDPKFKSVTPPGGQKYWRTDDNSAIFYKSGGLGSVVYRKATPEETISGITSTTKSPVTMFDGVPYSKVGYMFRGDNAANRRSAYQQYVVRDAVVLTPVKRKVENFDMGVFTGQGRFTPGQQNWQPVGDVADYDEQRRVRGMQMLMEADSGSNLTASTKRDIARNIIEAAGLTNEKRPHNTARVYRNGHFNIELGQDTIDTWGADFDEKLAMVTDHIDKLMTSHNGGVWDRPVFVRISDDVFASSREPEGVLAYAIRGNHFLAVRPNFPAYAQYGENGRNNSMAHQVKPSTPGPFGEDFAPSARGNNVMLYSITHEWGHMVDYQDRKLTGVTDGRANTTPSGQEPLAEEIHGKSIMNDTGNSDWWDIPQMFKIARSHTESTYGAGDPAEMIAEAFAEWHMTGGQTKNPVARFFNGTEADRIAALDQMLQRPNALLPATTTARIRELIGNGMDPALARYTAVREMHSIPDANVKGHGVVYDTLIGAQSVHDFMERMYGMRGLENMTPQEIMNYLTAISPSAAALYRQSRGLTAAVGVM